MTPLAYAARLQLTDFYWGANPYGSGEITIAPLLAITLDATLRLDAEITVVIDLPVVDLAGGSLFGRSPLGSAPLG